MPPKRARATKEPEETPKAKRAKPAARSVSAKAAAAVAAASAAADTPPKGQAKTAEAKAKSKPKAEAKRTAAAAKAGDKAPQPAPSKPQTAAERSLSKNAPLVRSKTPRELEAEASGGKLLRLLTVNVASLRALLAKEDLQKALRDLLVKEKPDIFCINEHKLKEEDVEGVEAQLRDVIPKEYVTIHWTCSTAKKGYSGVAVIMRKGVIEDPESVPVLKGMGEGRDADPIISQEGRLLTVELPELTVVAAYVPNSGQTLDRLPYRTDRSKKQCWDREFTQYINDLKAKRGKAVIVIGDLNCCHRVQDIWNMYERPDFPDGLAAKEYTEQYTGLQQLKKCAGLTPEERASFSTLLQEADLVDTFRAIHPEAQGVFSYFSTRLVQNRPLNRGLRLDYVLASSSIAKHLGTARAGESEEQLPLPRVTDSFILDEGSKLADHTPVGCHVLLPAA
mmetsp:Transcript_6636/g.14474  ORF Transcript_6636/g.14474 Transcript_6636/m.14474 type:complete len:450 (+) Transcript_6636:81-1430(+)